MTIRVLFFASLAKQVGVAERVVELPAGATVATALAALQAEHPELAGVREKIAVAVNLEYVDQAHVLKEADELALIPPVSGG